MNAYSPALRTRMHRKQNTEKQVGHGLHKYSDMDVIGDALLDNHVYSNCRAKKVFHQLRK